MHKRILPNYFIKLPIPFLNNHLHCLTSYIKVNNIMSATGVQRRFRICKKLKD